MYNNRYKNVDLTGKEELDNFLKLVGSSGTKLELFAMGGTAMVLKDYKSSTKDIDFMTTATYEEIKKLFTSLGLRESSASKGCNIWYMGAVRIDIFYEGFIMGTNLPEDWTRMSEFVKDLDQLKLYIMNWYDILITKIARSENRDIDDIKLIVENEDIDLKKLKERYYGLAEVSLIEQYDYKFKHIIGQLK